jgi:hypothetical protein
LPWLRRATLFAAVVTHIATISVTGAPCGSDFTIASTVVNTRVPPAAAANGTAGRAWSVAEEGCIAGNSAGLFASSTGGAPACNRRRCFAAIAGESIR